MYCYQTAAPAPVADTPAAAAAPSKTKKAVVPKTKAAKAAPAKASKPAKKVLLCSKDTMLTKITGHL